MRSFTFANALRLMLGLWVLNVPMLDPALSAGELATQSELITGGSIVVLATMRIIFVREAGVFRWAHLLLGLWTIASPWVFDYSDNAFAFWNSSLCGALMVGLAAWSLVR